MLGCTGGVLLCTLATAVYVYWVRRQRGPGAKAKQLRESLLVPGGAEVTPNPPPSFIKSFEICGKRKCFLKRTFMYRKWFHSDTETTPMHLKWRQT